VPLYEYQCTSCEHRFEKIQKFSDELIKICPKCGKESVEQMLSAPAVQFKGSGWYVTDYAHKHSSQGSSGPSTAVAESASSEPNTGSKTEMKSDSGSKSVQSK
jgi:putative FmdB family regulatory protein